MNPLPDNAVLVRIGNITFFVVAAMAVIGILVACMFIAANIRFRQYKLLKMTSPNLNLVMLSGAILCCVTVVLLGSSAWLSGRPSPEEMRVVCMLKHTGLWLGSVSFTLFFVPIAAKTWRVHRIFSDAAIKGRVIKDDKLLCLVAMFVIFDIGFLALWFGVDAPKCKAVQSSMLPGLISRSAVPDETTEDSTESSTGTLEHQLTCAANLTPMWTIILCVYKGFVLYYILYVAWATRYVTFPSMKDAGGLIIAIFTTLTSFCIGAPLVVTTERWPDIQYIILSLVVFIPLFTVMLLHFLPKLLLIRRHNKEDTLITSFSRSRLPEYSDDEIRDLAIQNASLRKEVTEKQRRYKAVLEQLRLTKAKLFKLTVMTSGSCDTFPSDDNMRSGYTESTGDLYDTELKTKRKESLAQRVTRALILKSQGMSKPEDMTVESSSTSQQVEDEATTSESTQESTNSATTQSNETTSKQTDTDVSERLDGDKESNKCHRHVSFGRTPSLQNVPDIRSPATRHQLQLTGRTQPSNGAIFPKPMVPVMGRKSWDYYTRGTGYLKYKTTILGHGGFENLRPVPSYHSNHHNSQGHQIQSPLTKSSNVKDENNADATTLKMDILSNPTSKTKAGDLRYFSTSASSRPPSSSTDITSSLGRSDDGTASTKLAPSSDQRNRNTVRLEGRRTRNNNNDTPSVASAFSVVSKSGRRPTSSSTDSKFSTKLGLQRIDDIGITYEDDYSSGSDSDEYNIATSMDSITCELFPPLTPRHKHYLRRYDAMQARYLANMRKAENQGKKSQTSERSEGYCSGNEDNSARATLEVKSKHIPAAHNKRTLLTRSARRFDHAYFYDSTTSSDSDSASDWENTAALKQCWERAAQAAQLPLLKPGPITYSHTRKDGIFV